MLSRPVGKQVLGKRDAESQREQTHHADGGWNVKTSKRTLSSQDLGLEAGLIFSRYFLKTEHLHYGYWTDNLNVDIANLPRAQENYCDFLVSHIPKNVQSVLDVGCGSGVFAFRLKELGYDVDCVSPSVLLTRQAGHHLNGRARIFDCPFEDLAADRRYDLALFSESFQYVDLQKGLSKSADVLTDGGYVMICDFFRKETPGESRIGGGKRLSKFYDAVTHHPFRIVEDVDITKETAPTMDLANEVCVQVLCPIWQSAFGFLDSRYPWVMKMSRRMFRKKIEKIEGKYFAGERSGEHFSRFKTYRLVLLQKIPTTSVGIGAVS